MLKNMWDTVDNNHSNMYCPFLPFISFNIQLFTFYKAFSIIQLCSNELIIL